MPSLPAAEDDDTDKVPQEEAAKQKKKDNTTQSLNDQENSNTLSNMACITVHPEISQASIGASVVFPSRRIPQLRNRPLSVRIRGGEHIHKPRTHGYYTSYAHLNMTRTVLHCVSLLTSE